MSPDEWIKVLSQLMHILTVEQLKRAVPSCSAPAAWVSPLNDAMLLHGIAADVDVMVEFLAQAAHETLSFNRLEESLNYSAERLMEVWPARFPNLAAAVKFARRPHDLAEHVYGGRMGNRPEGSGDGWTYRGRGIPMVTGLAGYTLVSERLGDPLIVRCPDRLCTKAIAAMAGASWWEAHPQLRAMADAHDVVSITRVVNGGTEGLKQRREFSNAFRACLTTPQ